MNKSLVLKNKLSLYLLFILSFFLLIYLFYFLINGERGMLAFYKINNQNSDYKITLNKLNAKNDHLIDRISRLQPNTLDLDYFDEILREKTGFVDQNELMIIFD